MTRALQEFIIEGIPTTIPFHQAVMQDSAFKEGRVNTRFIEQWNLER
jgi:acetyl-CoA carboxylase biotin carboxylase subunit